VRARRVGELPCSDAFQGAITILVSNMGMEQWQKLMLYDALEI
jgi:hypothetical protein